MKTLSMKAMLKLGQAETRDGIRNARADLDEGTYDIFCHIYLRNSYTFVYVTKEKTFRDVHRHYVQGGGHSEHSVFIKAVHSQNFVQKLPGGPANSRWENRKRAKAKAKASTELKEMLRPPAREIPNGSKPELLKKT